MGVSLHRYVNDIVRFLPKYLVLDQWSLILVQYLVEKFNIQELPINEVGAPIDNNKYHD